MRPKARIEAQALDSTEACTKSCVDASSNDAAYERGIVFYLLLVLIPRSAWKEPLTLGALRFFR